MIKELKLTHWKSFSNTTLYIDPLTVLMGLNASGKSNILDALQFLQRSVISRDIYTAIQGDKYSDDIRGGIENIALRGQNTPQLRILLQFDEKTDYEYTLYIQVKQTETNSYEASIYKEALNEIVDNKSFSLFVTTSGRLQYANMVEVSVTHQNKQKKEHEAGTAYAHKWKMSNKETILKQLSNRTDLSQRLTKAVTTIRQTLENIFVLDSIPPKMRTYAKIGNYLNSDGSNAAGIIAALPNGKKTEVEAIITKYAKLLPEQEIKRVWVETVGLGSDAMFYCEENFVKDDIQKIDARSLSDGTLRFLAILTAILTRPENSLLVVEEIDNGIHPSRAKLLLEILHTEGSKRNIDILTTTHNSAFLNELTPKYLPFVMYVHRNTTTGYSEIVPIDELDNLPFLLGQGRLGDIVTNRKLI